MEAEHNHTDPLTILLIEDNPDHAELVRRGFEHKEIISDLQHVTDGEEALDYLFKRGKYVDSLRKAPRPNLILLDLRLPKINGLEVLKEIKTSRELKSIPVVILTTSEADDDIKQAYDAYVNSYLVKPLDFNKFLQLLDELGFYWLSWNRSPMT